MLSRGSRVHVHVHVREKALHDIAHVQSFNSTSCNEFVSAFLFYAGVQNTLPYKLVFAPYGLPIIFILTGLLWGRAICHRFNIPVPTNGTTTLAQENNSVIIFFIYHLGLYFRTGA